MRRPSPAMVVALIALVAACAGTATAATLISGKDIRNNSVTGADIRDRALRGKDIGSNTVTGRNVRGLSGRDVIRNGLDGSDIDENTLETVPSATRARSAESAARATTAGSADALTGARIVRIAYQQPAGSATATLYDEGGLLVQAACSPSGALTAWATPSATGAGRIRLTITHFGVGAGTTLLGDSSFEGTDSVDLVHGGADDLAGSLVHTAPSGDVTTLQYLAHETGGCALSGNALHTTP